MWIDRLMPFDRPDEPVAAARERFDEPRRRRRVAERFPNPRDRVVQAVVEVHERIGGPDFRSQLLARHQLAGVSEQRGKDLQRLPLKPVLHSVLAQFASANVEVEHAEAKDCTGWGRGRHAGEPVCLGYHTPGCRISLSTMATRTYRWRKRWDEKEAARIARLHRRRYSRERRRRCEYGPLLGWVSGPDRGQT